MRLDQHIVESTATGRGIFSIVDGPFAVGRATSTQQPSYLVVIMRGGASAE